jgi:hypothetical protein
VKRWLEVPLCVCWLPILVALRVDSGEPSVSPKPQGLLVYGSDWVLTAKEPDGWIGNTENAAKWNCNVFFYPKEQRPEATTLIRVTVATKSGDDAYEDFKADMERYKHSYPEVQFNDIDVSHPDYRSYAKLYLSPGRFWDYVTYLEPSPKARHLISVSMNKRGSEANAAEMKTYRAVVRSVFLISD